MSPLKPLTRHVIRDHVFLGGLMSLLMLPSYGGPGSLLFWTATVMIDLDHYSRFFFKTRFRAWHPRDMFRFFHEVFIRRHRPEFLIVEYFHTVEVFFVLGWLTLALRGLWIPFFAGIVFHEIVDVFQLYKNRLLTRRCYSLVEYFWRLRRLKGRGLDPETIYREALVASGLEGRIAGRSIR